MIKTILIVEDNSDARDLLGMYFEAQGFNVKCACDGMEGWELLESDPPSLVLSDYLMPRMDGIELCRKIKKDERYANIPFILMTGTPHLPTSTCPSLLLSKPLKLDRVMEYIETMTT